MIERQAMRDLLAESFMEIGGDKPLDKITVQEISDNCNVSKRTFYNHFADKLELVEYTTRYTIRKLYREISPRGTYFDFEVASIEAVAQNGYYANAVETSNEQYPFLRHVFDATREVLSAHIASTFPDGVADQKTSFALSYYIAAAMDRILDWHKTESKVSSSELAMMIMENIPAHLQKRLAFEHGFWPSDNRPRIKGDAAVPHRACISHRAANR